jgi:death-on-curing protein
MKNMAVLIADNVIDKDLTHKFVTSLIYEDDYPETLKLAIAQAVSSANETMTVY